MRLRDLRMETDKKEDKIKLQVSPNDVMVFDQSKAVRPLGGLDLTRRTPFPSLNTSA
jgi:hypothetical protein